MGLTNSSVGRGAIDGGLLINKSSPEDRVVAIAGNPNVGKSTLFNALTGLNQHTGNWPGKTVSNAQGICRTSEHTYILVDIPGTYSLMAHSAEEEVARDFICFGEHNAVVVVCDATCIERNLNLVLQTLEITNNVIVCINLMDEAKRKNIDIDIPILSKKLGVPVVGTVARKKKTLRNFTDELDCCMNRGNQGNAIKVKYPEVIEEAILSVEEVLINKPCGKLNSRWLALKLIDSDASLIFALKEYMGYDILDDPEIYECVQHAQNKLSQEGIDNKKLKDMIVSGLVLTAEDICIDVVKFKKANYNNLDRKIDRLLTGRIIGYPLMILLLAFVLWLTITGANYPSKLLSDALFYIQDRLTDIFMYFGAPSWLHGLLVLGMYRVLAWVVSVMLPPMAIFFPLFTLLEDVGYLPRVAFNLDKKFKRCSACGKQALTMCMGFGCNAAGIVGCRIIDSPRERLIAIITNNFVPCNGRFPTMISIITMFFVFNSGIAGSLVSSLILTLIILLGIFMTFFVSRVLSKTILRGMPSSFTLELPPYRRPQVGKVIVRSIFDRTLFVLGRAAAVAAPAGVIIWIMANITVGDITILSACAGFLDPFGRLMGLDGVILIAFILGFPANEIVIPIIIMAYTAQGSITDYGSLDSLKTLLVDNGWTWVTAISTMLFSLMHWPCSTTCLTIHKETGSIKWTAVSAVIPTVTGIIICIIFSAAAKLFI